MTEQQQHTPLRDHVRLVDGPLADRRFMLPETPPPTVVFETAMADGRVIACEDDITPSDCVFTSEQLTYTSVQADDGCWSRDDHGFLLMTLDEAS